MVTTNAYIMIFEMEPTSSNFQASSSQVTSSTNEASISKTALSFPHTNGLSNKLLDSNGGKSTMSPGGKSNGENGTRSKSKDAEVDSGTPTPSPPPPPPVPPLPPPNQARRNFIGPQLPPHMEKNRYVDFLRWKCLQIWRKFLLYQFLQNVIFNKN